jgi:hypothetical protein
MSNDIDAILGDQNQQPNSGIWGSSWLNKREQCFWVISREVSMFRKERYTLYTSLCLDGAGRSRSLSTVSPDVNDAPHCAACEREWARRFIVADSGARHSHPEPPTTPPQQGGE